MNRLNVWDISSGYRKFCWPWWKHFLDPRTYMRRVTWAWQRMAKGYADCDIWNIDNTLSCLIPAMIGRLREIQQGIPGDLDQEQWDAILDKICLGFESAREMQNVPDRFIREDKTKTGQSNFQRNEEGRSIWVSTSCYDWIGYEDWERKKQAEFEEALDMLGQYFHYLWD